jgi:mono/diheme cytochrome c family protein
LLGAAAVGLLFTACKIDPQTPVLHFQLSEDTTQVDEFGDPLIAPKVQDHILGALEMLFGTPSNPQFMLRSDWVDDDFDPNYPQYPADDRGAGELDEDELDALYADNERRFRKQIEAIERGQYERVRVPNWHPDLERYWAELLDEWAGRAKVEDFDEQEFRARAKDAFVLFYPTLRDSAEMYRQQCAHCHGNEGGGNGPTADFLNPRPRDYRHGVFKFTAVKDKAAPRRSDLLYILEQGVTGTAMPSFARFSHAELNGLVDYVRLLSMRGMVERSLAISAADDEPVTPELVLETYADVFDRWANADEKFVAYEGDVPPSTPEAIARGKAHFMNAATGNCFSCHGASGRGDGEAAFELNEEGERVSAYQDDWGHDIVPRNLTYGIFRGGKRPIDIYRRIYSGINGGPMPAVGEAKDAEGNPLLTPDDIWDIVHYVRSLSERPEIHEVASDAHASSGSAGAGH